MEACLLARFAAIFNFVSHRSTILLTSLVSGIIGRIRKKINGLAAGLPQGKRAPTVLSDYEEDDVNIWEVLGRELLYEWITARDVEGNKEAIRACAKPLIQSSALDEIASPKNSSIVSPFGDGPPDTHPEQASKFHGPLVNDPDNTTTCEAEARDSGPEYSGR